MSLIDFKEEIVTPTSKTRQVFTPSGYCLSRVLSGSPGDALVSGEGSLSSEAHKTASGNLLRLHYSWASSSCLHSLLPPKALTLKCPEEQSLLLCFQASTLSSRRGLLLTESCMLFVGNFLKMCHRCPKNVLYRTLVPILF